MALRIVLEGDNRLFNQFGVILVNPVKHPNVKKDLGQEFIDWLVSYDGQKAIATYKINGEQLFFPERQRPQRVARQKRDVGRGRLAPALANSNLQKLKSETGIER